MLKKSQVMENNFKVALVFLVTLTFKFAIFGSRSGIINHENFAPLSPIHFSHIN